MMCTPNGRFATNTKLCLSMSDFHPETWNPMWNISTILTGLLSFMLEDEQTHGSIATTVNEKKQLARYSIDYNYEKNIQFKKHFPELLDKHQLEDVRTKSLQPAKAPASLSPSSAPRTTTDKPNTTSEAGVMETHKTVPAPVNVGTAEAKNETQKKSKNEIALMWFLLVAFLLLAAVLNQIL